MYAYRSMLRVHEDLFEVKRIFPSHTIKDVEVIKSWLGCTNVFQTQGFTIFCVPIEILEILEETLEIEPRPFIKELNCSVIDTTYFYETTEDSLEIKSNDNE